MCAGAAPSSPEDTLQQEPHWTDAGPVAGQSSAATPQAGPNLGMGAEHMQAALEMMRENPAALEQMRTAFAQMTPEQLQIAV